LLGGESVPFVVSRRVAHQGYVESCRTQDLSASKQLAVKAKQRLWLFESSTARVFPNQRSAVRAYSLRYTYTYTHSHVGLKCYRYHTGDDESKWKEARGLDRHARGRRLFDGGGSASPWASTIMTLHHAIQYPSGAGCRNFARGCLRAVRLSLAMARLGLAVVPCGLAIHAIAIGQGGTHGARPSSKLLSTELVAFESKKRVLRSAHDYCEIRIRCMGF
jgi:hypothetical protein